MLFCLFVWLVESGLYLSWEEVEIRSSQPSPRTAVRWNWVPLEGAAGQLKKGKRGSGWTECGQKKTFKRAMLHLLDFEVFMWDQNSLEQKCCIQKMSFCYFNFPYINGICLFLFIPAARPQGIIMSGLNYRNHILWSLYLQIGPWHLESVWHAASTQ